MSATTKLVVSVASHLADAWLLMVLVGMVHGSTPAVPAFGYWFCLFAVFVVAGIVGTGNQHGQRS